MRPRNGAAGWENSHPQRTGGENGLEKNRRWRFSLSLFFVKLLLSYLGEPKVNIVYS